MRVELTVLGSATSLGVPTIACRCAVCLSTDPRDRQIRPSLLLCYNDMAVIIDIGPDFRFQALRTELVRLDTVLLTHAHADHVLGLYDVRVFTFQHGRVIPIYGNHPAIDGIRRIFRYLFDGNCPYGGVAQLEASILTRPVELFGLVFTPIKVLHGRLEVLGFRFGNAAYLTDYNEIPESSRRLLQELDVVFLDVLRHTAHPTHMTVAQALQRVERIKPKRAYFPHIAHDLGHAATNALLPDNVELCYDGPRLEIEA